MCRQESRRWRVRERDVILGLEAEGGRYRSQVTCVIVIQSVETQLVVFNQGEKGDDGLIERCALTPGVRSVEQNCSCTSRLYLYVSMPSLKLNIFSIFYLLFTVLLLIRIFLYLVSHCLVIRQISYHFSLVLVKFTGVFWRDSAFGDVCKWCCALFCILVVYVWRWCQRWLEISYSTAPSNACPISDKYSQH